VTLDGLAGKSVYVRAKQHIHAERAAKDDCSGILLNEPRTAQAALGGGVVGKNYDENSPVQRPEN